MTDLIIILIIGVIIVFASMYIYKAKKRGEKCIGCPHAKSCQNKNCGCGQRDINS